MDGFTYTNIFETKGIEYLAILAFFAILIPFWILLNKQVKITKQIQRMMGVLSSHVSKIPQGLFFSKNHTWTHLQQSGNATVGLDDLFLHITGAITFTHLRKPGENIQKGELLTEVDQQGKILKIFSPISGKIVATNSLLIENPQISSDDPYGKGWIYKIKPTNWIAETNSCYLAEDATYWSKTELERFKDFMAVSMEKYGTNPSFTVLQDGGELCDNVLSELPNEVWQDFQQEFLNSPLAKHRPSGN
ncbi:MAG: glycine cleavage system protein H [Bacteroidota bacterium]